MNFSIQKNKLQKALNEHSKVVPIRTTLPILSCAEFLVTKNILTITTTDLDQTIISSIEIDDEQDGKVAIPMIKLVDIITALQDEKIKITSTEDNVVEINSHQGVYRITGKNAEDFPETTKPNKNEAIVLSGKEYLDIVEKTSFAASKDDLKPALTGVYIDVNLSELTAVSTDGHKLVKYQKTINSLNKSKQSIIIPTKFLNITKHIFESKDDVVINIDSDQILIEQGEMSIISRIIKEKFPDFNSVIPSDNKTKATISAKDFISCVKRVSIFSNRTTKQIVLSFSEGGVVVSAEDLETSTSGKEHLQCEFEGGDISISYNAKYLQETIQHIEGEKVEVYLNTPLSAAVLVPTKQKEKEQHTTLLMPLRLNS